MIRIKSWIRVIRIRNIMIGLFLLALATPSSFGAGLSGTVQKLSIDSQVLHTYKRLNVYLPPGYSKENTYPVLFIIHGMYANEDSWMPGLRMDREADFLINGGKIRPLIIVAPDMENSFGINSEYGRYEDYFCNELVPYIDSHFNTDKSRENRFIGGLSMGGFIALYIALLPIPICSEESGPIVQRYIWTIRRVGACYRFGFILTKMSGNNEIPSI